MLVRNSLVLPNPIEINPYLMKFSREPSLQDRSSPTPRKLAKNGLLMQGAAKVQRNNL